MRLKRIKLAGFKSFVDATSIPFPGEMTAIVGPNGCGKSNVIDAVRWVLGESSAKNLRGDAMTDVIFNGSSARKPVSQCSVELVFDNSSQRIQGEFANYNELAVKRVVTRDAQSTYMLNGTKCRRRDVTDIFLGTGLGPRSYAIIEQGMISRLIESKPQELRVFIEEAAGISKYKERRRETETRIRHTRENLERLADVRTELGTQLDKLQRQAAAAKRYTELKARERQLKAELAALRWLAHNEKVAALQQQIDEGEVQIEALVAEQRGDERVLVEKRQMQFELKQRLDQLQQQLFAVSTEITRLEQSQKFAQQRNEQITQSIASLQQKRAAVHESQLESESACNEVELQLESLLPELEICAEQLEIATENRQTAEQSLTDFSRRFREQELRYNDLKQQSQQCHSQIQSTMNMQLRTQQRVSEIETELAQLAQDQIHQQLASLQEQLMLADAQQQEAEDFNAQAQLTAEALNQQRHDVQQSLTQHQQQVQRIEAEHEALVALQADSDIEIPAAMADVKQCWQILEFKQGYESLVDQVLGHLLNAHVLSNDSELPQNWHELTHLHVLFSQTWTADKHDGTLASVCNNHAVPMGLNDIFIARDVAHAEQILPGLGPSQSVVAPGGFWRSNDALKIGQSAQGKAVRQARIVELAAQQVSLAESAGEVQMRLEQVSSDIETAEQESRQSLQALQHAQQAYYQVQSKHGMLSLQAEQTSARTLKLEQDQLEQKELLVKEQSQLEELSARIEEIEEQLLDFETEQLQFETRRDELEKLVQDARLKVEHLTQQKHQAELQKQQLTSQFQSLKTRLQDVAEQVGEIHTQLEALAAERETLNAPEEVNQATISELLEQRDDVTEQQSELKLQLADVEQVIADAEKGSHGVNERLNQRRAQLESLKLESQGFQVRATAVLEQLEDTKLTLKETLEQLSGEANEADWQTQLDKTQASISRLGAVNLAAVDEYEIQAERKQHLDDQHDDLQAALDTLEDAIRKIDKETKSRFRLTFDQVNDDLKQLFPKVFGGGSAYLDLTDNDLLETGVTIMARPPGKKNSTIHLLSGGEKALTALSLVFAIFRLNPAPFCLLDEVDAPLDDANVGRFCRLVSEMSKTVQFIYITHNKIAMEMAEHLTGVTMAEPGVSRMVAVDVDEAVAIANA